MTVIIECISWLIEVTDNNDAQGKRWKVKQSRYRPGVAQRVPGSLASQIS